MIRIGQGVKLDRRAVGHFAVGLLFHLRPGAAERLRETGERDGAQQDERRPAERLHQTYGKRLQAGVGINPKNVNYARRSAPCARGDDTLQASGPTNLRSLREV